MKKLVLTTLTACLLAASAVAAPTLAPEAATPGTTIVANCPGKPPVNA